MAPPDRLWPFSLRRCLVTDAQPLQSAAQLRHRAAHRASYFLKNYYNCVREGGLAAFPDWSARIATHYNNNNFS